MRIAQVAPLYERVPPKLYGGTERVVSYLTEELVRQGHAVTLFASGDSRTAAELVPVCHNALRLDENVVDPLAYHILLLERVFSHVNQFDVVHFHIDYLHFPLSRLAEEPHITTLHGRLDLPDLPPVYREFDDMPLVSISDAQREPLPWANWQGTVYHGLPLDLYDLNSEPKDYLAFLGRISPEKGVDHAVEIALRLNVPLKIAAKVDEADREYYEREIKHLLERPLIEFVGEIREAEKNDFLGNAYALLFPIDWPEPFGLVILEAMACGTPVVAFDNGSVPEVVDHGITGFVVSSVAEAVEATANVPSLSRERCRRTFEERFSVERMAEEYVGVYQSVLQGWTKTNKA
jgi:glycosyltransferase involved in cell wall biosynthesis